MSLGVAVPTLPMPLCGIIDMGCMVKQATQSAFAAVVNAIGEAVVTMVKFLSTFWLSVPSPTVANGGGNSWSVASNVAQLQGWLGPFTYTVAVISFAVAIARMVFFDRPGEARQLVRQVAAVGSGSLAVVAVTQLLISGGDAFCPWILQQASGGRSPSAGLDALVALGLGNGDPTSTIGLWFVVFLLGTLGAIMQCIFMIVRGAALVVLMVFVPPTAAAAASDEGWARFKRLGMLVLGFALYKPVAAIIYAVGIMEMTQNTTSATGNDVQNALYGLTIMVMAAVALPAFIKFLMPIAAYGSSTVFSGATAAGVAAGGAAIVATAGWGAGASAAGASGAAGSSGAAGGGGPAGGAGAGGADAATPPPPTGGGGGAGGADAATQPIPAGDSAPAGAGGGSGGRRLVGAMAGATQAGAGSVNGSEPEEAS